MMSEILFSILWIFLIGLGVVVGVATFMALVMGLASWQQMRVVKRYAKETEAKNGE
jgi:hypothetical protein